MQAKSMTTSPCRKGLMRNRPKKLKNLLRGGQSVGQKYDDIIMQEKL